MPDRSILDINSGKLRQARMNEAILVGSWPTQQELERIQEQHDSQKKADARLKRYADLNL